LFKGNANQPVGIICRGGQIRTDDILLPKQALYQAELRPVHGRNVVDSVPGSKKFLKEISFYFSNRYGEEPVFLLFPRILRNPNDRKFFRIRAHSREAPAFFLKPV